MLGATMAGLAQSSAPGSSANDNTVVVLKPYRVTGGDFDVYTPYDKETEIILSATVTFAAPSVAKYGLRAGCALISVNGKSVKLMTTAEFIGLMHKKMSLGEQITYEFTGKRGLLHRSFTVILTYTGDKDSNGDTASK